VSSAPYFGGRGGALPVEIVDLMGLVDFFELVGPEGV
jgi:hypothetical protein